MELNGVSVLPTVAHFHLNKTNTLKRYVLNCNTKKVIHFKYKYPNIKYNFCYLTFNFELPTLSNTSKQLETVFSWRKRWKLFSVQSSHINHKVRKYRFKSCVRPVRQHAVVAHKWLMFRTVQNKHIETHRSRSHLIWVKWKPISLQNGASFSIVQ